MNTRDSEINEGRVSVLEEPTKETNGPEHSTVGWVPGRVQPGCIRRGGRGRLVGSAGPRRCRVSIKIGRRGDDLGVESGYLLQSQEGGEAIILKGGRVPSGSRAEKAEGEGCDGGVGYPKLAGPVWPLET